MSVQGMQRLEVKEHIIMITVYTYTHPQTCVAQIPLWQRFALLTDALLTDAKAKGQIH